MNASRKTGPQTATSVKGGRLWRNADGDKNGHPPSPVPSLVLSSSAGRL